MLVPTMSGVIVTVRMPIRSDDLNTLLILALSLPKTVTDQPPVLVGTRPAVVPQQVAPVTRRGDTYQLLLIGLTHVKPRGGGVSVRT